MKKLLYILVIFISALGIAQNNSIFEVGKEQYKNGKFQEAINSWIQILDNDQESASLYFNIGNAHYKLNNIGPSVYYYEKALQLDPNDSDIKTNLTFAENARIDAIESLPKTVFKKWYQAVSGIFTFNGWAIATVVFVLLFVALFLIYYFSISERKKRLLFVASLLSIVFLFISCVMAFKTFGDFKNNSPAIIFAETAEVKSEPNLGSDSAFTLHEGTKVQIIAEETNWVRIELADGKDGWIPVGDLKKL